MRFETKAIHAGQEPEPAYGAVNVPIYQTSTYAQEEVGKHRGLRVRANRQPDTDGAGGRRSARWRAGRALCFSSGMAAEATFFYLSARRPRRARRRRLRRDLPAAVEGPRRSGASSSTRST